ncbi:MAG TPA: YebC/PmpR family DNA-binding transcriptional regulator [Alphaproteobacteria bacterium]|nr:YebC/PmpR family DNA-binding transcriptional regulator [Alphaproteobacteria bacterium]
MAGHSQFKNIMYRKGAQDKKRAKVFTKIIRELTTSARISPDPDANPRLRQAIIAARGANMPKDTLERAIKRGAGGEDTTDYVEVRYEGYGPAGVAVIVEALTDNRNRTAGEVRAAFTKFGGNLGETNSVSFMFDHTGIIRYPKDKIEFEAFFDAALDAGAQNIEEADKNYEVECSLEDFSAVRDALMTKFGDPEGAELIWKPQTTAPVDEEKAASLLKLIDILEDNDDVQSVFANFEVSDEVMEKLASGK